MSALALEKLFKEASIFIAKNPKTKKKYKVDVLKYKVEEIKDDK